MIKKAYLQTTSIKIVESEWFLSINVTISIVIAIRIEHTVLLLLVENDFRKIFEHTFIVILK